ncbi:MAG: zinc-ribbon domain containing protein [Ruminococcus sp.]|nr:zinc-ribbon domain containing protein [Ruminococcus sp.]
MVKEKTIFCKDCGQIFLLSDSEQDFFRKKNLKMPKRCKNCRQLRKNNQLVTINPSNATPSVPSQNGSDSDKFNARNISNMLPWIVVAMVVMIPLTVVLAILVFAAAHMTTILVGGAIIIALIGVIVFILKESDIL